MRSAGSVAPVVATQSRYITPIQRPMSQTYSQQQQQVQQAAMLQQQQQQQARQQQQQHRLQQQSHQGRPSPAQPQQKQYYQQQGTDRVLFCLFIYWSNFENCSVIIC